MTKDNNQVPTTAANHFLLELGSEELPPGALLGLSEQLLHFFKAQLRAQNLSFGKCRSFATPRRLAVLISGLADKQADEVITKKGPACDAPATAIRGFMNAVGIENKRELVQKTIGKKIYYIYQTKQIGKASTTILAKIIPEVIACISHPKMMRWGSGEFSFVRPVRWFVALYNNKLLPVSVFALSNGKTTYGLRFAHHCKTNIKHAKDYEKVLANLGIIADFAKRKQTIIDQIKQLCDAQQIRADIDGALLNEVCALVEAPQAFLGTFSPNFLTLPQEVLILAMQSHQRYFAVFDPHQKLRANFIAIANLTDIDQPLSAVVAGNERVITPRLADAQFFYDQDIKQSLASHLPQLKTVVFMQSLGSMYDKVKRLEALAKKLTEVLNIAPRDATLLQRSARLSKADLVSNVVVEFPKLQGLMGGYYARYDKEDEAVVLAISQQYYPRFSKDVLPSTPLGCYLSLLDKLDTITCLFALGKIPTGSKDPYGLRRLALGVIRIIIEKGFVLNLLKIIQYTLQQQPLKIRQNLPLQVLDFILERLKVYYTDQGIASRIYNAISLNDDYNLCDFNARLLALKTFSTQAEIHSLIVLNKRILNILKDVKDVPLGLEVNEKKLVHPSEQVLYQKVLSTQKKASNYQAQMHQFCALEPFITDFFDAVMVNDNNIDIRQNRLNLLNQLRQLLLGVADLSHL